MNKRVRALSCRVLVWSCIFVALVARNLSASELARLESRKELLLNFLEKVVNGREPCFSADCQKQKSQLILKVFDLSNQIPYVDKVFLRDRREAVESGFRLIRKKFEMPKKGSEFPRSINEWVYYWKKRYSHESELRSVWLAFLSQTYALYQGLQTYQKILSDPDFSPDLIEEADERGAGEIARLGVEAAALIQQSAFYSQQGLKSRSLELRQRAFEMTEQREVIEKKFRGQFRAVLSEIFPKLSFQEIISFFELADRWKKSYSSQKLFSQSLKNLLLERLQICRQLVQVAQEFTDLEYGVVGIKNFYTSTNPLVSAESEAIVQGYLDEIESKARLIIDLGSSYFLFKAGPLLFDSPILANMALPFLYNILSIQAGQNTSEWIWKPSSRSSQLTQALPALAEQMDSRLLELQKARSALKIKIAQTENEISQLKNLNQRKEVTNDEF